jgi:hypothetical protein
LGNSPAIIAEFTVYAYGAIGTLVSIGAAAQMKDCVRAYSGDPAGCSRCVERWRNTAIVGIASATTAGIATGAVMCTKVLGTRFWKTYSACVLTTAKIANVIGDAATDDVIDDAITETTKCYCKP